LELALKPWADAVADAEAGRSGGEGCVMEYIDYYKILGVIRMRRRRRFATHIAGLREDTIPI